ncbi:PilZ domain-containing protein [Desulfosediminicola flagellatus]|uniref:PilZ domain-containing protein n=1 Tax=Desulfosediminicola flagellatus TaxID=2569541 RepID=UPI0010AC0597|nr:PilZ domain-containing protein [Desulfosediminicola flagellatus]
MRMIEKEDHREKRSDVRLPSTMLVEVSTAGRLLFKGRLRDISRNSLYIDVCTGIEKIQFTDNREQVELKVINESNSITLNLAASVARYDSEGVALLFSSIN